MGLLSTFCLIMAVLNFFGIINAGSVSVWVIVCILFVCADL